MTKIPKPIGAKEAAGPVLRSEAFMEHAVERHRGPVIRLALARTRNMADAQDIAQNVFIKLLKSQVRFHDDEHLKAWLLRATHDACVDLHRQAWRRRVETREDMAALMDQDPVDPALEAVMDHPVWIAPWAACRINCTSRCTCTTSRAIRWTRQQRSWAAPPPRRAPGSTAAERSCNRNWRARGRGMPAQFPMIKPANTHTGRSAPRKTAGSSV